MDSTVGSGYKSASQIARRVTEEWAARNLYCAACAFNELSPARPNAPVLDFRCPECSATYQLKSKSGPFGRSVSNSAYGKKIDAIHNGTAPNYAFLHYSTADWQVKSLFLVPGHFFTPALIQKRSPLTAKAERAGWIGSNILLGSLPDGARVEVVESGIVRNANDVRSDWARFQFLQNDQRARGGWGAAVLACVRETVRQSGAQVFQLQDFYALHVSSLSAQFPDNHNVEAKVRQQLQVLRDGGVLTFLGDGKYQVKA